MQRREFGKTVVGGAVGAALGSLAGTGTSIAQEQRPLTPRKNLKMYVGGDYHNVEGGPSRTTRENLMYHLRYGVKALNLDPVQEAHGGDGIGQGGYGFNPADGPMGGAYDVDVLKKMKDDCDAVGMGIATLRMDSGFVHLTNPADQDKKLDQVCENIRKAAGIDVHVMDQHWRMIPIRRNLKIPGRGDSVYTAFKLEDDWKSLPPGIAGHVTLYQYWERIEIFLKRVIPVCAEYKVAMANHLYDPPGLPWGYQGVENFDSPSIYDAYKRYEKIVDSPWNGFQMDCGVIGEGSTDVNRTEPELVRYLLERGKVKHVHMRNIKGGLNDFAEVYPDEGVVDLFKIMRIFRDTGYEGAICPDHLPSSPGDPNTLQGYAFGYGYLHGLINGVNSEVS